jgi:hypothetical protein
LGPRAAVDQTLSRLVKQGLIRRLDRGLYDYPRQHDVLGTLSPDTDKLAQALSARYGDKVFPSGAVAANKLGLSTQVPAKPVYLTSGSSRTRQFGGRVITLKHARVPLLNGVSNKANAVLQALAHIGKNNIDQITIQHCAALLTPQDLRSLIKAAPQLPGWLSTVLFKIQQAHHGSLCKQG